MNGLLNPWTAIGAGLLSTSGHTDPSKATFGAGLSAGLNNLAQFDQMGLREGLLAEQIRASRSEEEMRRQQMEQQAQSVAQKQQAMQGLLGAMQTGNVQEMAKYRSLLGDIPGGIEMLNPQQEKAPTSVQEYQYAVQNDGFSGTYSDWIKAKAEAGRTSVSTTVRLPDVEKPVGDKANEYTMPDGSTPNPLMSVREIVGAGGKVLSDAEKKARGVKADIAAKEGEYTRRVAEAEQVYKAAKMAWDSSKTPANKRALDEAAFNLNAAKAQKANIAGEPSDSVMRGQETPGAINLGIDQLLLSPLLQNLFPGNVPPVTGQPQPPPGSVRIP